MDLGRAVGSRPLLCRGAGSPVTWPAAIDLPAVRQAIMSCTRCPRRVAFRTETAGPDGAGSPVAGFGDPLAGATCWAWPPRRVVVWLGVFAWDAAVRCLGVEPRPRLRENATADGPLLLGCYHPSPQNAATRRLTPAMLDDVLRRARELI